MFQLLKNNQRIEPRTEELQHKIQQRGSVRSVTFTEKSWSLLVAVWWAFMIGVYDRAQRQGLYSSVHSSLRGCTTTKTTALWDNETSLSWKKAWHWRILRDLLSDNRYQLIYLSPISFPLSYLPFSWQGANIWTWFEISGVKLLRNVNTLLGWVA